jgi:hypothetical protein
MGMPPVGWQKSLDDTKYNAQSKSEPFAIYFCAEECASTAGEGGTVIQNARKSNPKLTTTIWDSPALPTEMKKAGISLYAKVVAKKENAATFQKYGAGINSLVICAPNGDKLALFAGEQCTQSAVISFLKTFPDNFEAWKKRK